jgi:hypothetical protein
MSMLNFKKVVYYFRAHNLALHTAKTKLITFTHSTVPDRKTGSCLDPKLPGTGLQEGEGKSAQPPQLW